MDLFRGPSAGLGAVLVGRTKIGALLDIVRRCRLAYQHPCLWRDGDVDVALRRRQNDVGCGDRLYSASNANALGCLLRARGCSSEDDQREGDKGKAHGISPARTGAASRQRHRLAELAWMRRSNSFNSIGQMQQGTRLAQEAAAEGRVYSFFI